MNLCGCSASTSSTTQKPVKMMTSEAWTAQSWVGKASNTRSGSGGSLRGTHSWVMDSERVEVHADTTSKHRATAVLQVSTGKKLGSFLQENEGSTSITSWRAPDVFWLSFF